MRTRIGGWRFAILMALLVLMALLPIKMLLRWTLGVKYLLFLPELGVSV